MISGGVDVVGVGSDGVAIDTGSSIIEVVGPVIITASGREISGARLVLTPRWSSPRPLSEGSSVVLCRRSLMVF